MLTFFVYFVSFGNKYAFALLSFAFYYVFCFLL